MKFRTLIRKSKLNNGKEFYSYIRQHNSGEATLIDFDLDHDLKLDKWYECEINVKNDKIVNIIIKQ